MSVAYHFEPEDSSCRSIRVQVRVVFDDRHQLSSNEGCGIESNGTFETIFAFEAGTRC